MLIAILVKDILESNIAYSALAQKLISPLVAGSDIMVQKWRGEEERERGEGGK
jgi:hypothetical protein